MPVVECVDLLLKPGVNMMFTRRSSYLFARCRRLTAFPGALKNGYVE